MNNDIRPPQPPKLTPDVLAQNDFEQHQLAAKASVPISSKSLLRARAVIKDWEAIPAADLSPKQTQQLIQAYSQAGFFQKAYDLSGDDVFLAIANATEDQCDCPDFETVELKNGKPVPVKHSQRFKLRNIVRNGQTVALMACNKCGHLSTQ